MSDGKKNKNDTFGVICWGAGNSFFELIPRLEVEEKKKNIKVIGVVDKNIEPKTKYEYLLYDEIVRRDYDYIIISSSNYFEEIRKEIIFLGVDERKVVDYRIFFENNFDFAVYVEKQWINNRIINNSITEVSYEDKSRIYYGKNIKLYLGRKSYIGGMIFDNRISKHRFVLKIGNYTSVSTNVRVEIGLNFDHDYKKVTNYGLSHLFFFSEFMDELPSLEYSLIVGSDVWIGQNVIIKAGIRIGDGAVVAANSYVVKDVPDYAIIGGNPAEVIKYRFERNVISELREVCWWNLREEELKRYKDVMDDPLLFLKKFKEING